MAKIIYTLIILSFLIFLVLSCTTQLKSTQELPLINVNLPLNNVFFDDFIFNLILKDFVGETYLGEYDNTHIRVKKYVDISADDREDLINEKLFFINSLYREIHSPYPGQISNAISCDKKYLPVKNDDTNYSYHVLFASDRLTYGACNKDLVEYKSLLYFIHCSTNLFSIEIFHPLEKELDYNKIILNTSC